MASKFTPPPLNPAALNDSVKESAQQIWLAGLGAFAKAQQEGGKVFETLVNDGLSMQRRAQTTAEEKIAEATQKMTTMAQQLSEQASQFGGRATGSWDKLESIFEDRVAKALVRLGLPTAAELEDLKNRVAALEKACVVARPKGPRQPPKAKPAPPPKTPTKKK